MTGEVRVQLGVALDLAGAEITDVIEIDRGHWDELCEEERARLLKEYLDDFVGDHLETWTRLLDDEPDAEVSR